MYFSITRGVGGLGGLVPNMSMVIDTFRDLWFWCTLFVTFTSTLVMHII